MATEVKNFLRILHELEKLDSGFPIHYAICLGEISLNEGISMTELSKSTGLSISTISRIIGALSTSRQKGGEAYNLVHVKVSEKEKRRKEVYLTEKGQSFINSVSHIIAA